MTTVDGAELFYRAWVPVGPVHGALVLFHRGHEHSGRWQETVEALGLEHVAVFAWDQRGHGRSSGPRGQAPSFACLVKDADLFARRLVEGHGVRLDQTVVVGHSVGAVVAAAWVHDYGPPLRGLVLATPAFRVKLYVPLALSLLRLRQRLLGPGTVSSYVKARMLTADAAQAAAYENDPLVFRQIAVNLLLELHDASTRLLADAGAIGVPTLLLAAGRDWVVELAAQREFYRRLGAPVKQFEVLAGSGHAIFHETGRDAVFQRLRHFILECLARPAGPCPTQADRGGHTRTEFDLLSAPGAARWALIRAGLKSVGRLSRGVRLGWANGFDSGATLDYVYENRAAGTTPIGRLIDRCYLNAIGWRGIRVRRAHLERALRGTIQSLVRDGRPVRVLDIASGPGRYVLETLSALPAAGASAVLRDYRQENLDAARALAGRLGVQGVSFECGDAFDRDTLAAVRPRPMVAIVSGLYELFANNDPVRRSLEGLAAAIEPGGYLIYTNQPWHPQVEFIARVLTNREGRPWIMRRRTQAEIDALVGAAGFAKLGQDIDRWGIFTVSVARREPR